MNTRNPVELMITKDKLRLLEECYLAAESDKSGSEYAREVESGSLKRRINQFKEEIIRHETGCVEVRRKPRLLNNDQELLNTKEKLRLLEASVRRVLDETDDASELRDMKLISLRRMRNQLKEEIIRYEARQIVPR